MKSTTLRLFVSNYFRSYKALDSFIKIYASSDKNYTKVIEEAEKVVEKYMCDTKKSTQKKRNVKRKTAHILCIGIVLLGAGIFAVAKFIF